MQLGETTLVVATAEDVLLAKLEWAKLGQSERQVDDVAGVLRVRGDELDFGYLERWVEDLGVTAEWERARRRAGMGSL